MKLLKKVLIFSALAALLSCTGKLSQTEKWDYYELPLIGPSTGNPFKDVLLSAVFFQNEDTLKVQGFYDGAGVYKIRFMPAKTGIWNYTTISNIDVLNGQTGSFNCIAPSESNHGPVKVANTYHFAYADGTPYYQIGTTSYAWAHQGDSLEEITLNTLAHSSFNKLRMCIFPNDYVYNKNEPVFYAFERDSSGKNNYNRFDPLFWQHLEKRILQLRNLGIEADLILFHPYDRWGYQSMSDSVDAFYLKYLLARFSSFRNVWWSAANEFDLMEFKNMDNWHEYFRLIYENDPYKRLTSIHNGVLFYDHSLPWITHASIQSTHFDSAQYWLERYRKPLIFDECRYEGDIPQEWGRLTAEEMTAMFWKSLATATYAGHGESYLDPGDVLWWSKGGVLKGKSPERIGFFKEVFETLPYNDYAPVDNQGAGKYGESYIYYFNEDAPNSWSFELPANRSYKAEIIDTWNMTSETAGYYTGPKFTITMPGKKYMAVKITNVHPVFPIKPVSVNAPSLFNEYLDLQILHPEIEKVRYTLDGSDPEINSMAVTGPVKITEKTIFKARAFDQNQSSQLFTMEFYPAVMHAPVKADNLEQGLRYRYYTGIWQKLPDFSKLQLVKSGITSYPDFSMVDDVDYFGIVYEGYINIPEDDIYSFYTRSDDGSILFINGIKVVNNDETHALKRETGHIGLKKGLHPFELHFFDNWYAEYLETGIRTQKMEWQPIPKQMFYYKK